MHANFHLSLPCFDLEKTKQFYVDVLGLPAGRSTSKWLDVNLFNHQVTFVTSKKFEFKTQNYLFGRQRTAVISFWYYLRRNYLECHVPQNQSLDRRNHQ